MLRKVLVVSAGMILVGLLIAACATPAPTPQTIEKQVTVVVKETVVVQQPAPTAAPTKPAPTAVPPTAAPVPVNAEVMIVPVAANAAGDKNVLTATIKIITDTAVGPSNATVAMGHTGLNNVPINVPVHVSCQADDPKATGPMTPTWTLYKPADSKAALKDPKSNKTEFTPDVVGAYEATCSLPGGGEVGGVQLRANTFVGMTDGKCATCHATKVEEWAKTGHSDIFSDNIDNKRTPTVGTHYTENCVRCHTTGYYAGDYGGAGGFKDAMTKANWTMPTWKQIDAAGKGGPSNFAAMPAALKNVANIQCEQCHGPAGDHVKNGTPMATSMDEGVCNVCHNGGGHHDKGEYLKNAGHSQKAAAAFNTPIGFGEQACVRCHSGEGYVSFLDDPNNPAAWVNEKQTIVCATCHDPHSDENPWQLRITSKPVGMPFEVKQDVGLSATCFECHNSRTNADEFVKGTPGFGTPHYSSIAEMISGVAGVTYGQTLPNSPHGQVVGMQPIVNPAFAKDPTVNQFMFSKTGDTKGNIPGPCVTCHMWAGISDTKDPNYAKVGGHSFNTVSPDGKFDYGAACKSCHGDVTDFNLKAKADYDGNGKVEGDQDEVKGLLDQLWKALEAKGLKKVPTGYPYATIPRGADGKVDPKINSAWYNFRTVYGVMWGTDTGDGNQGKAQAVHNFKRTVALLQLSLKDLTGSLPAGATEMK